MKKLEDFTAEKVELKSIYGGRMAENTFSCNTYTLGGPNNGCDDGSDEADDK